MKAARLNSDLLSRKGDARPALVAVGSGSAQAAASAPAIAEGAADLPQGAGVPALKRDKFGRARISLRLDPRRHLRLRLLAAHAEISLQETLIAALDAYLGDQAQDLTCECLHGSGGPARQGDNWDETRDETRAAGIRDPE